MVHPPGLVALQLQRDCWVCLWPAVHGERVVVQLEDSIVGELTGLQYRGVEHEAGEVHDEPAQWVVMGDLEWHRYSTGEEAKLESEAPGVVTI